MKTENENGEIRFSFWDSKAFYRKEKLIEEEVIYGYISPSFLDQDVDASTRIIHQHLTPLMDDSDPTIRYGFRWIFSEKKTDPIIEPLKLKFLKLKTRNDNGLNARRKYTFIFHGKARTHYATQIEEPIPRIETFPFRKGVVYKFYYRFNDERITKTVKSTKRYKRTTPTTTVTDNLLNKRKYKMILYRLTATSQDMGISLILYELKLKPEYQIKEKANTFTPRRVDHKKLKTVDYARLMRYEKRISKKWFKQLIDAIQDDNPTALNRLPTQLQKIARKVVTHTDITPPPLKAVTK